MKIQELAIIFVIIILPISLLLSEYTQFQIKTITTQTEYDAKLTSATYDAIKAFQLNSTSSSTSDFSNSKIRDIEASINAFRNSIMSTFKLNGYTEDELNNYIPALVYTLYDGLYIYSPYENINYRYETDEDGEILTDKPIDNNGEQLYGLKPYINYSCRYAKGNIDVVITYTLDNYVTVRGKIGSEYVNKSGYLIDNITVEDNTVKYNGVTIEAEQLKENIAGNLYNYAKINGMKYYLLEDQGEIIYFLNGTPITQCKIGDAQYISWRNLILNNDSAKQYYKDAYEFTKWFKDETDLDTLTYADACDEVIADDGTTAITQVWPGDTTLIFDFNTSGSDASNNIENELSNFNQHRLAVIRHKIETNMAIAISNYNLYSGETSNVFQMPELKESEWEHITHNISLISFLQGLHIGGKVYNGYSLVTNSESKEVVLEEYIYILGNDGNYHKIGDKGFEDGTVNVDTGLYGDKRSAGRLNLDFERSTLINNHNTASLYYYPLKAYNASYDSIVMQSNVTTYDDIYEYVNEQSYELKEAFYTALGRERYSSYKFKNNITDYYSVLVVAATDYIDHNYYKKQTQKITEELNKMSGIKATYVYNTDRTILANYIKEQKSNYNLIIIDTYIWPLIYDLSILSEVANETNVITISNDDTEIPMIESGIVGPATVTPVITNLGKTYFGDISINPNNDSNQAAIKFKDDVEVFYTGTYSDGITGQYDLIGCRKNGNYKWIHSQISLEPYNTNDMKLLRALVNYAIHK